MALPDVHVEVAFDTDPLTRPGAMDWTRIDSTCGLRALSTRRGAGLRDGTIVTGTASATLDNRTGDLLPENTSGAWYPDLTLRKRIRFMKDGTDPLFTGFIDRLPVQWDKSGSDGLVELEAVDLLALLAQIELPPSVLHQTIMDLDPVAYWPLAETQGTNADDVAGSYDGTYSFVDSSTDFLLLPGSGTPREQAQLMPFDERSRSRFTGPVNNPDGETPNPSVVAVESFPAASASFTFSVWARPENAIAGSSLEAHLVIWNEKTKTNQGGLGFYLHPGTGRVFFVVEDGTSGDFSRVDLTGVISELHHYVVRVDDSLSAWKVSIFVDGVEREWTQIDPLNPVDPFSDVDWPTFVSTMADGFLMSGMCDTVDDGTPYSLVVGDLAYFDSALSDDDIRSIYEAGVQAWSGDTTGARVERVLDAVGVDDDDRDIDAGIFTCGPTQLGGNALEYLRKIAATERGALFVSADGKITFQQQYANDPTPLDVIGDAGCPYSDITLDYSLDRMVNTAEVTAENSIAHTFQDSTAVTAFGPLGVTRETLHSSPSGAKSLAAELVVRNKDLRTQVVGVELESRRADVPSAVSVDTEIGDPYTISYEPPGVGSAQTVLVRVESISHRFTPGTWTTRFDVDQQVVLPDFQLDTAGAGADQGVLAS